VRCGGVDDGSEKWELWEETELEGRKGYRRMRNVLLERGRERERGREKEKAHLEKRTET
jgi:hypothetical protein